MTQPPSARPVLQFKPNPAKLLAQIRLAAAESRKVGFSRHALERMEQRDITNSEAIKVLQIGEIDGEITAGNAVGEWKCKVTARMRGSREIGVATVVAAEGRLHVKTVEWEDR